MSTDLEFLFYIGEKAVFGTLKTSTIKLAKHITVSQQTISRKLRFLDKKGLIRRKVTQKGMEISLTEKGILILKKKYLALKKLFENQKPLEGIVRKGDGEGGYYISIYLKKLNQKLGFKPYKGTLNLEIEIGKKKLFLGSLNEIHIPEFKTNERSYGSLKCYRVNVYVESKNSSVNGAIIVPERTRHPANIIEVIAPVYLRRKFDLRDKEKMIIDY